MLLLFVDDVPDDILDDCFTALIIIESFQRFFLRKCHHIRQALRQKCDQFSKKRLRHKRSILNLCNKLRFAFAYASTKRRAHTTSHNHPRYAEGEHAYSIGKILPGLASGKTENSTLVALA